MDHVTLALSREFPRKKRISVLQLIDWIRQSETARHAAEWKRNDEEYVISG